MKIYDEKHLKNIVLLGAPKAGKTLLAEDMIFEVPFLISYISQFMTLLPGDVISTGTPAGVGLGMKPPQFLKAGDVVELGIDGLGESRQQVIASGLDA